MTRAAASLPALLLLGLLAGAGCKREQRNFRDVAATPPPAVAMSELRPGPGGPAAVAASPYEANAAAVSEGKRLFQWYNCSGCHSNGGGGMGPALMDDAWIYGHEPPQIFASIVEGRPNGMPAFGGRINDQELWQLVAYVRSLSGLVRFDVVSGRDDHMTVKPAEQAMEAPRPKVAPP